jgi:predicted ATP-dependent serine protease
MIALERCLAFSVSVYDSKSQVVRLPELRIHCKQVDWKVPGLWRVEFTCGRASAAASDCRVFPGLVSQSPVAFDEIVGQEHIRFSSGIAEFDRALGGGIVSGSLILIGGDPGIGKSTLLLQAADRMQQGDSVVLYISAEESEKQIKMRGDRLGIHATRLFLLAETCLERILDNIDRLSPNIVILDSIQTVYSEKLPSAPGSFSQVRKLQPNSCS